MMDTARINRALYANENRAMAPVPGSGGQINDGTDMRTSGRRNTDPGRIGKRAAKQHVRALSSRALGDASRTPYVPEYAAPTLTKAQTRRLAAARARERAARRKR